MLMRDSVNRLFHQRFTGHEMPVDPGVWTGIEEKMASMTAPDGVNELFKARFDGHEVAVDPAVWNSIGSRLGHAPPTPSGFSWGWAAAGIGVVAIGAALVLGTGGNEPLSEAPRTPRALPQARMDDRPAPAVGPEAMHTSPQEPPPAGLGALPVAIPRHHQDRRQHDAAITNSEPGSTPVPEGSAPVAAATKPGQVASTPGEELVESIILELTSEVVNDVRTDPASVKPDVEGTDPPAGEEIPAVSVVAEEAMPKLFMPNTFTPNGDLINDTYSIGSEGFVSLMIRVYSLKTNALVFSTNTGEAWTGSNCEDGMYMVAAEARTANGRTVSDGKVVWLNRNPAN